MVFSISRRHASIRSRFRRAVMLSNIVLLAVIAIPAVIGVHHATVSRAAADHSEDLLSGDWNLVMNIHGEIMNLKLKLKLDGESVSGNFESSTPLGNGPIAGIWRDGKFMAKMETSHAPLTLTGEMKSGKLAGDWDAGQVAGKWEATRKKG